MTCFGLMVGTRAMVRQEGDGDHGVKDESSQTVHLCSAVFQPPGNAD